jgi:hypothetical protein
VTDELDFEFMRRKADALGFWVGEHKQYDPCLGGGPYYVQRKKTFRKEHQPSLLRYATAEMVWDFLSHYG